MTYPQVTLAGLPITPWSGAVDQAYTLESGWADVRLSQGHLIRMSHWQKETISLSGTGFMGLGFDGLDYTQPLELRCTLPKSMTSQTTQLTLTTSIRPDIPPWAEALVNNQWRRTPVVMSEQIASVTPVTGASLYRVCWMPRYFVLTEPPVEALDSGGARIRWQFNAREI